MIASARHYYTGLGQVCGLIEDMLCTLYSFAAIKTTICIYVVFDIFTEEQLKEDYVKLVPSHTVPAIDDNGFVLSEW